MDPTEHPLHSSSLKLQWIAIGCMAFGLITSTYYHVHTLKAERIESELTSYLHLNDRYHKLLFTLLENDPEIFQKNDDLYLQKNKYIIYELFELLSMVDSLKPYFLELRADVWPCWEKRMEFLFSKPAVQHAWASHAKYAERIYKPEFIAHVESMLAHADISEPL